MSVVKVKIVNNSSNPMPKYQTLGSAGMDLMAMLSEPVMIKPLQRTLIPTGIFIELPTGHEAQIRPRSGLAYKKGLTVLNSPGTIDSDYRGELKIILINLSNETVIINTGERIAQVIIAQHSRAELIEVLELSDTERGEKGFGHTGVK